MKKIFSFLFLGITGAVLLATPQKSSATTVDVVYNTSSGIENANMTATLADGTILGFQANYQGAHFCGAITNKAELAVPDSISDSSQRYAVSYIGSNGRCDFENAQSVETLSLPATIEAIYALPETVKELYTNSYIESLNYDVLSNLKKVLVPESTLASYYENHYWSHYVLINAEGSQPLKLTINMTKAGEFAQLLLQKTDNWYKVNDLTVVGELNTDDLNVFKRMKQLTRLDLSGAVITDIPDQFDGATGTGDSHDGFCILEDLILPDVDKIGSYSFAECYRLKNITMPKVNSIGEGAFSRLGAKNVKLPEGLMALAYYTFYNSELESIDLPSTLTEISNYCFQNCGKLKSVEIPKSVKWIGDYSFYDCKQLENIRFSEGMTGIGSGAFYNCEALTELYLPGTLLGVYDNAFGYCKNVKKVTSKAVIPPYMSDYNQLFAGCDMTDVRLYVPQMSIDSYRAGNGWKEFYTILPTEEKISDIYIYNRATIDDASQFTTGCNLTIEWYRDYNWNYHYGALDYNGATMLSMHNFTQYQYLGSYNSGDSYSYSDALFSSLVSNGDMRADNVQTLLRTDRTNIWYFISLPYDVKVSDIVYTAGAQFAIRKYSGLNRAKQSGETWLNLTTDSIMHAYEGYILKCNKEDADFVFTAINNSNKNKVFEKESVVKPLGEYLSEFEHNRSWNLIGNPYPCYYDTRFIDFSAPITVWNRHYERYDAYSPIDDSYILHPSQAFFVQRPVAQASITFGKEGRQHDATVRELPASAKQRAAVKTDRKIYNVYLSDGEKEDHTRFVVNANAIRSYELDKDASKFINDNNAAMLVYTVENGVRYAINERPADNGVVALGFYVSADGEYTLSLDMADNENVVLVDHETNTETAMSGVYSFHANAGYNDTRFSVKLNGTTGIDGIGVDADKESGDGAYSVYTIDGRLVGNYSTIENLDLSKGIYIVSGQNTKRKIVVK